MDKKYNQFPAGVYSTSKIFLQADPITGALEKVNLPTPGGGSSGSTRILSFLNPVATPATGVTTPYSGTIPANTLVNDGDQLRMRYYVRNAVTANEIGAGYNCMTRNFTFIPVATAWPVNIDGILTKLSASTAVCYDMIFYRDLGPKSVITNLAGIDFTIDQVFQFKLEVTSTANNFSLMGFVDVLKA